MPTAAVKRTIRRSHPTASPRQLAAYFAAKLAAELGPHDVRRWLQAGAGPILLDVRDADGYAAGHIPGAVNIPFEALPQRARELPQQREIVAYCWNTTCLLSTRAALWLAQHGFRSRELVGGIAEWRADGFPVVKGRSAGSPRREACAGDCAS